MITLTGRRWTATSSPVSHIHTWVNARFTYPLIFCIGCMLTVMVAAESAVTLFMTCTVPNAAMAMLRCAATVWFAVHPPTGIPVIIVCELIDLLAFQSYSIILDSASLIALIALAAFKPVKSCILGALLIAGVWAHHVIHLPLEGFDKEARFVCFLLPILTYSMMREHSFKAAVHRRELMNAARGDHVVEQLHDYTTNNLTDIILLANQECNREPPAASSPEATRHILSLIGLLAQTALTQTRLTMRTISDPIEATNVENPWSDEGGARQRGRTPTTTGSDMDQSAALHRFCQSQQEVLRTFGFTGDVIITEGPLPHYPQAYATFILEFVRELFANIFHHANPPDGYAMSIGFTDDACIINLYDTARAEPERDPSGENPSASGKGLPYYHKAIAAHGGQWSAGAQGDRWALRATIPVPSTPDRANQSVSD